MAGAAPHPSRIQGSRRTCSSVGAITGNSSPNRLRVAGEVDDQRPAPAIPRHTPRLMNPSGVCFSASARIASAKPGLPRAPITARVRLGRHVRPGVSPVPPVVNTSVTHRSQIVSLSPRSIAGAIIRQASCARRSAPPRRVAPAQPAPGPTRLRRFRRRPRSRSSGSRSSWRARLEVVHAKTRGAWPRESDKIRSVFSAKPCWRGLDAYSACPEGFDLPSSPALRARRGASPWATFSLLHLVSDVLDDLGVSRAWWCRRRPRNWRSPAITRRMILPERVLGMSGTIHNVLRAGDLADLPVDRVGDPSARLPLLAVNPRLQRDVHLDHPCRGTSSITGTAGGLGDVPRPVIAADSSSLVPRRWSGDV